MTTRYGPCRRSESRATRSKIERTADLKAPGSTSPGCGVDHLGVDVEHHGSLLVRAVRPPERPRRVRHPPLPFERHQFTVAVPQLVRLDERELHRLRRVPEAKVDAERARDVRNGAAEVAEPAHAVAVRVVEADAGRAADVSPVARARIVLVRRLCCECRRGREQRHDGDEQAEATHASTLAPQITRRGRRLPRARESLRKLRDRRASSCRRAAGSRRRRATAAA